MKKDDLAMISESIGAKDYVNDEIQESWEVSGKIGLFFGSMGSILAAVGGAASVSTLAAAFAIPAGAMMLIFWLITKVSDTKMVRNVGVLLGPQDARKAELIRKKMRSCMSKSCRTKYIKLFTDHIVKKVAKKYNISVSAATMKIGNLNASRHDLQVAEDWSDDFEEKLEDEL